MIAHDIRGMFRFMASMLFGVEPHDLVTYLAVFLVVAIVALIACYVPARRVLRVDPAIALRVE